VVAIESRTVSHRRSVFDMLLPPALNT